jgi:hypothetical protein
MSMDPPIHRLRLESLAVTVVVLAAFTSSFAQDAAPKVIATHPRNGDQSVAVDLREVVVTFDQDMDTTGYSFVGGGPTFPKVAGKPAWRSARECVLPVQLEAGHSYTVGINSATKGNFKSRSGVSAAPMALSFTARGRGDAPKAVEIGTAMQADSVLQLCEAIDQRYSHRDVHVVDWPAAWKQFEPRLLGAKTAREFAIISGEMLAATKDAHIWLVEGGEIVPAFRRGATPNASIELLPKLVTGWTEKHPMVAMGRVGKDTGYIAIHSWENKHAPQVLDASFAALTELKDLPSLIVDVRFNGGGNELLAREFAGCFVREPRLYERHVNLDPASPTRFSKPQERWIEPSAKRPAYTGRVAVLMGPVNMSSTESFLLMMKQAPNCKLVGARSHGASGNPQPHVLANGVTVMLPSWKALLLDGTELETKGIAPDVEVRTNPEDFSNNDPVLSKALESLKP